MYDGLDFFAIVGRLDLILSSLLKVADLWRDCELVTPIWAFGLTFFGELKSERKGLLFKGILLSGNLLGAFLIHKN